MIGVKQVLRSSSRISAVNILGGAVAFFTNVVIARRVGPEVLGAVGLVNLWLLYAGLLRPGLVSAAFREMLHRQGSGEREKSLAVQNVALTWEGALLAPTAAVLVAGGALYDDPLLRVGMALGAVAFVARSLVRFQETLQWVGHRFELIAQAGLISRLATPLLSVAGAYLWGGYGLLAAPILPAAATWYFYCLRAPESGYRASWDRDLARGLFRVGFPLTLMTLLYWGFRTSDRSMVAAWLPLQALGYFAFAMNFIDMGIQLSSDFYNVLQARLLSELGRVGRIRPMAPMLTRLAVLTVAATCAGANVAQAGFHPLVAHFLPTFLPSVVPFEVLVFNLACLSAPMLPATLLTSAVLERQRACVAVQLAGLGLNVALGAALTGRGLGLVGIALSSVAAQLFVGAAYYGLLHRALFEDARPGEARRFYAWLAALCAACAGVYAGLGRTEALAGVGSGAWLGPTLLRAGAVGAVWAGLLALVHRSWWSDSTALRDLRDSLWARFSAGPADPP